jgi:hypothetical protein
MEWDSNIREEGELHKATKGTKERKNWMGNEDMKEITFPNRANMHICQVTTRRLDVLTLFIPNPMYYCSFPFLL